MATKRPQDLVFTLYGEYCHDLNHPVWVGALISLLQPFGLSEAAVRTVLSRMVAKGWLRTRRRGRKAFYDLTAHGRKILDDGSKRIFHPNWDYEWDGRWYLLSYSIPEDVRHVRDRLRIRLAWMGFGSLGNGMWISPHDVDERVAEMVDELEIQENLVCFRAEHLAQTDHFDLANRCWDLEGLAVRYRDFLRLWGPGLDVIRLGLEDGTLTDEGCYVRRFNLLHEFRHFPLDDPYLPKILLPDDWPGRDAVRLFKELHDLLEAPAERHVASVLDRAPTLSTAANSD